MNEPPSEAPGHGSERRKTHQLLAYWNRLRGNRTCPPLSEFDENAIIDYWPYCFVMKVVGDPPAFELVTIGSSFENDDVLLADATAGDISLGSSVNTKVDTLCREVISRREPVQAVGSFQNPRGEFCAYRSIVVPLSDDQRVIDHLVGLFSYVEVSLLGNRQIF